MTIEQLNGIAELKYFAGDLQTADAFTGAYSKMLATAKGDKPMLEATKRGLMAQTSFMMQALLREHGERETSLH